MTLCFKIPKTTQYPPKTISKYSHNNHKYSIIELVEESKLGEESENSLAFQKGGIQLKDSVIKAIKRKKLWKPQEFKITRQMRDKFAFLLN